MNTQLAMSTTRFLLLFISILSFSNLQAQTIDCSYFCVKAVAYDSVTSAPFDMVNVTIENKGQLDISYFTVHAVLDEQGDTVAQGPSTHFILASSAINTFDLSALVNDLPTDFKGKIVVGVLDETNCELNFPCKAVGLPELPETAVKIFPNPAAESLFIQFTQMPKNGSATLPQLDGKQLLNQPITGLSTTLQTEQFARGIYLLTITTEQGKRIQKVALGGA